MKQTRFDSDPNENGSNSLGERTSNFIKGLGSYFAVASTFISSFLIFIGVFSGSKTLERAGVLSLLTISLLFLLVYSSATARTANASIEYKVGQTTKRFFELVLIALASPIVLPVFVLLSVLIRIDSPGPIMFVQKRVGQFGKPFEMYRFRTMYLAPTQQGYTRVGKVLRWTSLDELPQLINVLNGEMSLVGPRSRTPQNLKETLDSEGKILTVKPGLTGLWQIFRSPNSSSEERIRLDLLYVQNWSLGLDVSLLFKTVVTVIREEIKKSKDRRKE